MDGRELVDRAHVTRLQAELAQMTTFRDNAANHMRRIRGECTAAEKERDALKAEVERLRAERSDLRASNHSYRLQVDTIVGQRDEAENQLLRKTDAYQVKRAELTEERAKNDKLQDELTKARELIGEVCDSIANCDHYRKVCTYLAHQSAPAACWTPANHECPGDGVGACKKCPDAPAAKGERYECIGKGGRLSVCSHRAG
jgi:uncharacterized small protein (DUF1192 family)